MVGNSMLPVVSQYDIYEDLHCTSCKMEHHHIMHFFFGYYLTLIFTVWRFGLRGPKERPPSGFLLWGSTKINSVN